MSQLPTLDTAIIPGIRRVFSTIREISGAAAIFGSTEVLPPNTVMRTLRWQADATLNFCRQITLRLAYGMTPVPVADDFTGTGRILPDIGEQGRTAVYHPDPLNSAVDLPVNFKLPATQGRILFHIIASDPATVNVQLRMILDGLIRLGTADGSR